MTGTPAEIYCSLFWPAGGPGVVLDGEDLLIPAGGKEYHTHDESGLFRTFAELCVPEGYYSFAVLYGGLVSRQGGRESLALWRGAVAWMRSMVQILDALREGQHGQLQSLATVEGGRLILGRDLAAEWRGSGIGEAPEYWWPVPEFTAQAAEAFLAHEVGEMSARWCPVRLMFGGGTGRPLCVGLAARTLWGALAGQLFATMASGETHRRCAGCHRWFPLLHGSERADKLTCGTSCRQRVSRMRRKAG